MLKQLSIINSNIQKLIHILFAKHSQKNQKQSNAAQHDSCSSCVSVFFLMQWHEGGAKVHNVWFIRLHTVSGDDDDLHSHFI